MRLYAGMLTLHRAVDRAVRAEDTAIAIFWPEQLMADLALVIEQARVGRHGLGFLMPALGTGDRRFKFHSPLFGLYKTIISVKDQIGEGMKVRGEKLFATL